MLAHSLRRPLLLSLGVLALVALLTGLLSLRPALAAEAVSLNPTEGPPETQVTATGSGWTSGNVIKVEWDNPGVEVARTTVDNNGGFTVSFRVPKEATPGTHNIYFAELTTSRGHFIVIPATFTVTGSPPQPSPAPTSPQPPAPPPAPSGLCNGDERMTFEPDHPIAGQPVSIHVGSERLSTDVALSGPHNPSDAGVRSRGRGYRWTWTVTPDQPGRYGYTFTVGGTVCARNFVLVEAAPFVPPLFCVGNPDLFGPECARAPQRVPGGLQPGRGSVVKSSQGLLTAEVKDPSPAGAQISIANTTSLALKLSYTYHDLDVRPSSAWAGHDFLPGKEEARFSGVFAQDGRFEVDAVVDAEAMILTIIAKSLGIGRFDVDSIDYIMKMMRTTDKMPHLRAAAAALAPAEIRNFDPARGISELAQSVWSEADGWVELVKIVGAEAFSPVIDAAIIVNAILVDIPVIGAKLIFDENARHGKATFYVDASR